MSASNYLVEAVTAAHDDDIWALQYLQDGRVLSASADRHLRIWDSSKSEEPLVSTTLTEEEDPKPSSIVGGEAEQNTSSSSYALVSVMGRSVFRISLKPDSLGAQEASWSSPELGQASTISLHPDPQVSVFAASGMEGMVRILSSAVDTFGEEKARIQSRGSFARVRYSPNGRMLATAMETGQVALYNAETYALVQYWTAHVGAIRALTFSPDSSLLITGGEDKQINVFDVKGAVPPRGEATSHRANGVTEQTNLRSRYNQAGQHVASLSGHTGWVVDLSCRDDGRVFASSSTDGTIRLWDLQRPNSACLATLREHESDVWCVRWAPTPGGLPQTIEGISGGGLGGGKLVSAGKDGQIRWWRGTG